MGASVVGGGSIKESLQAAAKGFFLGAAWAAAAPALGSMTGVTSAAGQAALGAGAAGTGLGLLTGKSLQASIKEGLTAATVAGVATGGNNMLNDKGFMAPAQANAASTGPAEVVDSVAAKTPAQIQAEIANQGNLSATNQAPVAPPVAQNAPGADPLGDFIAQNDTLRNAANTPAVAKVTPPSFTDSISDFYDKNISPSGRAASGLADAKASALSAYKADIAAGVPESIAAQGYQAALKAATPGVFSTYGPMIGAGMGAAALLGGFESKPVQASSGAMNIASGQATRDLMAANPKDYLVQNLPGVQYDAKGNITGSTPWTPRKAEQTEVRSAEYIPFKLHNYQTPANSIGSSSVYQPFNTASMYTNLQPPRFAAQGGIMETQGAFPANPLTMQSNPAMAMGAQPLPMNTPGVPMNVPMGFANGGMPPVGIASLAAGGYPRRTGQISGPGTETSDDIPAMLSDGEFVMTAKAVKGAGGGSRRAGAKKMYALMHRLEKNAARG